MTTIEELQIQLSDITRQKINLETSFVGLQAQQQTQDTAKAINSITDSLGQLRTQEFDLQKQLASLQEKINIDVIRQESRTDTTPTIQLQGQTTENQSWLPLLLIGLGFLVLAN